MDTARVYASWLQGGDGASEKTIGEFLKSEGLRETAIIATKGGHPPLDDMHNPRINKLELTKDLNESLENLTTDYIDIYYLHRDNERKDVSEIMPILDGFVKEGKVKYLGASNWKVERIIAANKFARENNLTPFLSVKSCGVMQGAIKTPCMTILWSLWMKMNTRGIASKNWG